MLSRWLRQEMQPYKHVERGVEVYPSTVHGLGLFTRRSFKKGELVCYYSGTPSRHVTLANLSKYIVECLWNNPDTDVDEKWYLDSVKVENRCGRYINDARHTGYDWNVKFGDYMSDQVDISGNYFIEVRALVDIPKGVELFVDYGNEFWESS